MGDGASDRAPVADLDVADPPDAIGGEAEWRRLEGLRVRRERPDLEAAVRRGAGALELGQAPDVDERAGRGQPQLHQRQQAHPARKDLGVPAGEGREGVVERGRPPVLECRGDHAWPPFASWIADQTFSDV